MPVSILHTICLVDASSLTQLYSSLCATPINSSNTPQLNQQAVADLYGRGLAAAADLQRKAVKPDTLKTRQAAIRELADWLQSKQTACKRTVLTVIPEDILVYFTQHWLPNHAGSMAADGELIAAPGSLSSTKSHLSSEFEQLGRNGNWDSAKQTGNPMLSAQVRTMLKGYGNHAMQLGYQKKGAVPLTEAEMQLLLQSMHQACSISTDPQQQLLLLRDGMLFSLLWQSCFRGFNAGALRLDNIVLPTGENAVPYLVPQLKLQAGAVLHLLPDTTKNKKGGHCKITLTSDVMCFSTWFQMAAHHYAAAGQPITNHIIRPLGVGTKQFAEKPMTCSNAWARLTKCLKALDMYTGQSVHSTRRGNMIHRQQHLQESHKEIGEAAMCNEKNAKYYTDTHRPTRLRISAM